MAQVTPGIIIIAGNNGEQGLSHAEIVLSITEPSEEVCCIKAKDARDTWFKIIMILMFYKPMLLCSFKLQTKRDSAIIVR